MGQSRTLRVVQISDTHLFANVEKSLLGVKTNDSFQATLDLLRQDAVSPDIILLTGDLSQDESEESYVRIADKFAEFATPVYCLPGNHDNLPMMEKVFSQGLISLQKQLIFNPWQLILLNSQIPGSVEGFLGKSELDFLEKCLQDYPQQYALIAFHHHCVPTGCSWLDNLGLTNAEDFWKVLQRYPKVRVVLFGHVHQVAEGEKNSIHYYSAPSTCIQFKTKSEKFALDNLPPGYRLIDLFADGSIKTSVRRAKEYVGEFDLHAKGY